MWSVQTNGFVLPTGAFGTLGVGGGFALGAKLCRPESEVTYWVNHLTALSTKSMSFFNGSTVSLYVAQVWIVYGDGSLGYTVAEFDTFTRHKVKLDRNVSVLHGTVSKKNK